MEQFVCEIIEKATKTVYKSFDPTTEWRAHQIADGVEINLNHERFYTRVRSVGELKAVGGKDT